MKKVILLMAFIVILGCSNQAPNEEIPSGDASTNKANIIVPEKYSMEEISQHNNANDCWLLINNKVYDVTSFTSSHPGGNAILQGCGTDATNLYETRPMGSGTPHSEKARNKLKEYYIGDLK
ncbi:cytochrome b5 domain-containing protein [Candidatus Woesearchaeota archaeon]|nr:MAG: cytochrome b5 domain-containing protein [Candidatus Woesearchaeota archaeon]